MSNYVRSYWYVLQWKLLTGKKILVYKLCMVFYTGTYVVT